MQPRSAYQTVNYQEREEPGPRKDQRRVTGVRRPAVVHPGIQVVRFHVWQDLRAGENRDVAPLHATVTLEMTRDWYLNLSKPSGTIKIEGLKDKGTLDAKLVIYHAHYGLGLTQPGSRQLQFVMSPTTMYNKLDRSKVVRGIARMKFNDRHVTMQLPETNIIFTR